jgi:hypothetical protein
MCRTSDKSSRKAAVALLAVALLCLIAGALMTPRPAEAAPAGVFSMSPSNIYLDQGDAIAITIILGGGQDVHEVHFVLSYDPAVVQVVDAHGGIPGVQLLQGPFPPSSAPGTMLQNIASGGTITYQYVLPAGQMATGSGTVATAQFIAIGDGSANFAWQTLQIVDDAGTPYTANGTVATLLVGQDTPTPGPTDTPTVTPTPTNTPVMIATNTPVPAATSTPGVATDTPVATSSPTPAATATATPAATNTTAAGPSATPRITVLENSNQGQPPQSSLGVDPSQTGRADGLPSAGSAGRSIAWWRWVFFLAALMFGVAGWFFTLAVYNGNKEVVLIDRFDKRRRRG